MSKKLVKPHVAHKVLSLLGQMLQDVLGRYHANVNEFLILLEQQMLQVSER